MRVGEIDERDSDNQEERDRVSERETEQK